MALTLGGGFWTMRPQVMKIPHSPAMQQTLGRYAISPPRAFLFLRNAYPVEKFFKINDVMINIYKDDNELKDTNFS